MKFVAIVFSHSQVISARSATRPKPIYPQTHLVLYIFSPGGIKNIYKNTKQNRQNALPIFSSRFLCVFSVDRTWL